jgi:hypothetical protein
MAGFEINAIDDKSCLCKREQHVHIYEKTTRQGRAGHRPTTVAAHQTGVGCQSARGGSAFDRP